MVTTVIIIVAVGIFFSTRKKALSYKTVTVQKSTISSTVAASGKVIAKKEAKLHFQTAGRLAWVGVLEGDSVRKWQAIASLDKREVEKNLTKALRDYSKERNDFDEDLQVTYKDRTLTDTIKRILEKNQWDLDKAVLDVELKDITLQYATLITPISGIVSQSDTPVAGVNVTTSDTFTIIDPASIVFEAEVDETDIGQISIGQQVTLTLDSYQDSEFIGAVSKIAFLAVTTSSGGTAFIVDIALPDNTNLRFKPGMNGDAKILLKENKNVLTVPFDAVFNEEDKSYVYVYELGKAVKKEVQKGIEGDAAIEINSGLSQGEKVIENASEVK